jgi:enoyl-CoA hydratase/carnithine racemase
MTVDVSTTAQASRLCLARPACGNALDPTTVTAMAAAIAAAEQSGARYQPAWMLEESASRPVGITI